MKRDNDNQELTAENVVVSKTCRTCSEEKPLYGFRYVNTKNRNGYHKADCDDCERIKTNDWYARNGKSWKCRPSEARSAEHRREAERKGKTYRTRKEEEAFFFALHREAEKENNRDDAINTSAAAAAEAA